MGTAMLSRGVFALWVIMLCGALSLWFSQAQREHVAPPSVTSEWQASTPSREAPSYEGFTVGKKPSIRSAEQLKEHFRERAEKRGDEALKRFEIGVVKAYGVGADRAQDLSDSILQSSNEAGVDPLLFSALVMTESSYRSYVRSSAGALGPAQVVPRWWEAGLCSDLVIQEPGDNLTCGARVLAHYTERCQGDVYCALRYYNVGPEALKRNVDGARAAAMRYQRRVTGYWEAIRDQIGPERLALNRR